jgi:ABC-type Zn2+ transport system substrate-binding protein/surface adhesin
LDIKPYIKSLDLKLEANDGWYDELPDKDHKLAHLLALPHDHSHEHSHDHSHNHSHSQGHSHGHGHGHSHLHHASSDHKRITVGKRIKSTPKKD